MRPLTSVRSRTSVHPRVTAAERAAFAEDGFVIVPGPFVTPDDLATVTALIDPLFTDFNAFPGGIAHDLGGARTMQASYIPELEYVTTLVPALRRTRLVQAFHELAQDLYDRRVRLTFDHAIYKPPGSQAVTPWHQDSGYAPDHKALTVWVPLQDTDASNGCMRYVRGSHHHGPQPHEDLVGRHGRTVVTPVDETRACDAPVLAGGAVIHGEDTLHSAGPNNSSETRRSLILQFSIPTSWSDTARLAVTRAKVAHMRNQAQRAQPRGHRS